MQYRAFLGSTHARALVAGNAEVAVCTDCHTAHHIQPVSVELRGMPLTLSVYACARCHAEEFAQYQYSEHGRAALEDGDPTVPLCVDCHGSHQVEDPALPGFRRHSPYLCAACHADEALMAGYGLNTEILTTYVSDFHGATVQLFPDHPERAPDQAVCYDCHGVHNIGSTIAPDSGLMRENLIQVCQDCHPDAGENFPAAWMGHYTPSPERYAPVYWIRTIYIGILTVGMAALVGHVGLDMNRLIVDRLRRRKEEESDE
jgi:predicted CXXCH cytochrome family protein